MELKVIAGLGITGVLIVLALMALSSAIVGFFVMIIAGAIYGETGFGAPISYGLSWLIGFGITLITSLISKAT